MRLFSGKHGIMLKGNNLPYARAKGEPADSPDFKILLEKIWKNLDRSHSAATARSRITSGRDMERRFAPPEAAIPAQWERSRFRKRAKKRRSNSMLL
jgi:hypothetical protein